LKSTPIKLYAFFAIITLSILFMIVEASYKNSFKTAASKTKRSIMQAFDITFKRVNTQGVAYEGNISVITKDDQKEVFEDVNLSKNGKNREHLESKLIIRKDDTLFFDEGVLYKNAQGVLFETNSAKFAQKDKIASGENGFWLKSEGVEAKGESFLYDTDKKELKAQKIYSKIYDTNL